MDARQLVGEKRIIARDRLDSSERQERVTTAGIILCGGQSQRMGRPKAWLPFGNELLLPRVVRLLREVVAPIVVVAAPDQEVPPLPDEVILVRDELEGRGPMQGLAAGLNVLRGRAVAAFLSACDVPFLQPTFVQCVIELLGDHTIGVPRVGERDHPLAAVYRVDVVDTVVRLLQADRRRMRDLFAEVPTRVIEAAELADADPAFRSLQNLNTLAEYQAALDEMKRSESHAGFRA